MPKKNEIERNNPPPENLKSHMIVSSTEKKSFLENIWKIISLISVLLSFFLLKDIIKFQDWASQNLSESLRIEDLYLPTFAFFATFFVRRLFQFVLYKPLYQYIDDKNQGLERIERTKRVIKWIYDIVYYSLATLFVYTHFGDANFLPPTLLGTGDCNMLFDNYPNLPKIPYLKEYYLVQLGSHFCSVFEQIFFKRNDLKYYEYFLHHYLAFVLIFYSYGIHQLAGGSMIMIMHDLSDIVLSLGRALEGFRFFRKSITFIYAYLSLTLLSWAYFRTFVFPTCMIYQCTINFGTLKAWDMIKNVYTFEYCLLIVLFAMNIYWVVTLAKMLANALKKKTLNNNYDPKLLKKQT